ncbi:MAG: c-type cytochrome [Burkholderiales bacterium]
MKSAWMLWFALLLAAFGVQAQGSDPQQALRSRSLAATCAQCHGTDGRALPQAVVPGLAGLPAADLVMQMKAFKNGTRPATVMQQIAKGYSDAQIEQLAAYFSAQAAAGAAR